MSKYSIQKAVRIPVRSWLLGAIGASLLLVPRLIGTRLRQPPLLIALSILGAASAFGAVGILVGPAIVSLMGALVQELRIQVSREYVPHIDGD